MGPAGMASLPPPMTNNIIETPPSPLLSPTSIAPNISSVSTLSSRPPTLAANVPNTSPGDIVHTGGPDSLLDPEYYLTLPQFAPMASPVFTWGACSSEPVIDALNTTYAEAVHWNMYYFKILYGKVGKSFVSELARLFNAFTAGSAMESIALKAVTLMPILLLQKPAHKSNAKDLSACQERRLKTWLDGDLHQLLREGRTLQQRIPVSSHKMNHDRLARSFANLMFQGKTNAALCLLCDQDKGRVLHLDDHIESNDEQSKVRDILADRHPPSQPPYPDNIVSDDPLDIHFVLFESLNAAMIRFAALQTRGAAGPSGVDALGWRRLCTSFKFASHDLCQSLASVAKHLYTDLVDPTSIAPFIASRLIVLNKNTGVHPISIDDTARHIIAKAILTIIRQDVQEAVCSLQLCACQISGIKASVHAVQTFQREETEAILVIDARNAFNSLNRQTTLQNIQRLCPSLATVLINTYRASNELYVDGDVLYSLEGMTQFDPLAMPMYALATIPLFRYLKHTIGDVNQAWYVDDACTAGEVTRLCKWWHQISTRGPRFRYFNNATKTWIVTKQNCFSKAAAAFVDTGVKVTSEGRPYLGAPLGTDEFIHTFVESKV